MHLGEQGEVGDRDHALDAGRFQQRGGDLLLCGVGALRRGSIRQLQREEHVALIFGGKKSAGKAGAEKDSQHATISSRPSMASADLWISTLEVWTKLSVVRPKEFVERGKAFRQAGLSSARFVLGLQQQRGKRRGKRERVERRDQHRDRDGYGELLIKPAGDAGNERGGNEDRGEDQRDRHHRAAHLFHRLLGGGLGLHALFDVVLDRLDHDDGVVDHQADGEHQAEERKRVDGEAERGKDDEGADQRDRHGQQRNERGAPALKKDEDDDDDQRQRFQQREDDLMDAGGDRLGGVERNVVRDAGGEGGRELLHALR